MFNIVVRLSEVKRELNDFDKDRIVSITLPKWITSCGRVTQYFSQSKVLNKEKQTRNVEEGYFTARSIDVDISTRGWSTFSKKPDQEANVRRLFPLELVASKRPWTEESRV